MFVKDLSRLGRPLEHTVIIDNLKENFSWQTANGIEISSWYCEKSDTELLKIGQFLTALVEGECQDFRQEIPKYNFNS